MRSPTQKFAFAISTGYDRQARRFGRVSGRHNPAAVMIVVKAPGMFFGVFLSATAA
jgi:hypothetical protein